MTDAGSKQPLIEFRSVSKVYGSGAAAVRALTDVDLTIEDGEFVAIMGPSGSGKSTAMNILGCLDTPTTGDYRFRGVEVGRLAQNQRALIRRHMLGFVFQGFNLLARTTALENVELPLIYRGMPVAERQKLAARALERVGLAGRGHHTSAELSGGQQQRVAIARALAMRPDVLLLDEVTSALDPELVAGVLKLLREIGETTDITILCVTHEMGFARDFSHRVMMFDGGRIVEDAPPEELFTAPREPRTQEFLRAVLGR